MTIKPADLVIRYLDAWTEKDAGALAASLDSDVTFKGPLSQTSGRDAFVAAATRMFPLLQTIRLRHLFVEGDAVLAVYDFRCAEPLGNIRTSELLTVRDGLILSSELFFDASPLAAARKASAA